MNLIKFNNTIKKLLLSFIYGGILLTVFILFVISVIHFKLELVMLGISFVVVSILIGSAIRIYLEDRKGAKK